uniref:UDP-glucuronosyltransferase n=1 Tax=Panagrolaimus davidi TaxID=227884 RepID=A0A914PH02_9BILA
MIDLCGLGIAHFLGIKNHIWHSTTPLHDNVAYNLGVPSPISYVPSTEENLVGTKMTFRERAFNFYMYLVSIYLHHYGTNKATAAIQKIAGPTFPNVRKIASESTLAFINSDEFLDIPRPILHKTIYIGGLGIDEAKPVEEPFNSFLMQSKNGVIVFSLGTIAPTALIDDTTKQNIINIFSQFKDFNFIVKVDKDEEMFVELAAKTTNILTTSWMPQSDILGHERIKLFIMHGGFNGLLEAAIRGVPVIVIPLYADQYRNAKTAEYRGFGIVVEKMQLGGSALKTAINTILTNSSHTVKAKRISALIRSKPFKPNETFIKWINFVSINGLLPELTPEGAKMGIIEYFCLDVIVVTFSLPIFIMFFVAYIIRQIYYYSFIHTKLKLE